jgi:hypothetical protein
MRRIGCVLLLFLLAAHGAAAQGRLIQCSPRVPDDEEWRQGPGEMDLTELARFLGAAAPSFNLGAVRQSALATPTLATSFIRPDAFPSDATWRVVFYESLLVPRGMTPTPSLLQIGRTAPPTPGAQETPLVIELPWLETGWLPTRWDLFVLACADPDFEPGPGRVNKREIRGFAHQAIYVSSLKLSAAIGVLSIVGMYLALAAAAAGTQARQYGHARAVAAQEGRHLSRLGFALRPTVIIQDAFGHCSLARFQVLLFTVVLTGVYSYVMVRTGSLPNLSPTVLTLLGITLAGSALARVAEGPVVDTPNRLWLLGTGVLDRSPRLPSWRDLIAGEGEIDVTRVQALVFTIFAAAALAVNGTADLASFEIPDQVNQLMGISQVVYVAGKALPRETAKRLNDEVRALRESERAVLAAPGDPTAAKGFETARNAVGSVLFDVFGERFDDNALRRLTPGRREPPPVPET